MAQNTPEEIAEEIWGYGTRTLTESGSTTPSTEAEEIAEAIWDYHTRTLSDLRPERYSRESLSALTTDDEDLAMAFSEQDYTDVEADDNDFVDLTGESPAFNTKLFKYTQDETQATQALTFGWKGKTTLAPSASTVYLQVYNYDLTEWETVDSDDSASADTEFELTANLPESRADYVSSDVTAFRVYQEI